MKNGAFALFASMLFALPALADGCPPGHACIIAVGVPGASLSPTITPPDPLPVTVASISADAIPAGLFPSGAVTPLPETTSYAQITSSIPTAPTPEPATLLLFATGLAGLVGWTRARKVGSR